MKKLRRIISMLMVLVLFIGILPMNLGAVKAEAELDDTTKLNNIKVRAYNSETEIWDDIGLTIKEYVGSKQDTIYTPIEFDPGRRLYQIKLDPKYKKIQFYIEKAYEKQAVEIKSGESYKIRNSNYTEETVLQSGSNTFEFYVKPSNGSATREYFFSVDRGDTTKDASKIHRLNVTDGSAEFYEAYVGDLVTITAMEKYNMVFDRWVIVDDDKTIEIAQGNDIIKEPDKTPTELIMPNTILTIKPTFKESIVSDSNLRDIVLYGLEDEVWKNQKSKLAFKKEQKAYTVDLSEDFSEGYLYFQFGDSIQSIFATLNNKAIVLDKKFNGYETEKLLLNDGENTFKITVISEDGTNKTEYTLRVNRGEVKYNVSFNPGDGYGSMDTVKIAKGSTYTLPDCTFTAPENKEFAGWKIGEEVKNPGVEITIDKETLITATWKDVMVSVSFNPGDGKGSMDAEELVKGSKYTLPNCDFTAPGGQVFKAWEVAGEKKAVGDVIIINEDTEVIAIWRDKPVEKYKVTLVANNDTDKTIVNEVKKGTDYTLPTCDFTAPEGQVFKAWQVDDNEYKPQTTIRIDGETVITAIWQAKQIETVTVTLVANNDTDKTIVKEVKKGTDYTLPDCKFTAPEGQVFKAWEVAGEEKAVGDKITVNGDTEITATWKDKPNESDPDETNPDKPNPDKPNTGDEENPDKPNPGEESNPDKPNQKHAINITPSPCGEVIINPLEAKAGDKVTVRAIAKYGYELVGLSLHDASGELLPIINGEFIMPDGEVSIYPIFREIAPYIEPEIYDKAEREEQKMRDRRNYYHEEEKDEDDVKTIDKAKEEKQKESKVLITIGSEMLDKVDGGVRTLKAMDTKPYIKGGRTMLPLRYIAEALGYRVAWLSETRTAVIMDLGLRVEIPVDSSFIIVNGVKYTSDVKPDMLNNRIMLPIANIARALGLKDGKDILWDEVNRQVTLIRNFNAK